MKRFVTALLAAAVAGALFVASPLIAAPPGTNHNSSADQITDCDGGVLTLHVPEKVWPPNHKYFEDVYALAVDDDPEGDLSLTTMGTHDQYDADGIEQNGAGNTADDMTVDDEDSSFVQEDTNGSDPQIVAIEPGTGIVQTDWKIRQERSGRDQSGREYRLDATATWSNGKSCSAFAIMTVPHDMRPSRR